MNETAAATFCATLVDEWCRSGMTDAFLAPGSRSTPMALALAERDDVAVHIFHDERSAAFAALGHGLAMGRPAVVLCSSGTAGTHFHAAVVEADLSSVPLLVCTADRPPELWNVGAPQVIDQTHLFGSVVRSFVEPGVPQWSDSGSWRSLGARAWLAATGEATWAGPVHLNLSFGEPLVGIAAELPPGRADNRPWHEASPVSMAPDLDAIVGRVVGRNGVIIAGAGTTDPGAVSALAAHLGWPVLADHRSGCRTPDRVINHFDALLRDVRFAERNRPQVILRFGQILASKVLSEWIATSGADVIVGQTGRVPSDPERVGASFVKEAGLALALLERLPADLQTSPGAEIWLASDQAAEAAIAASLAQGPVSEPAVAANIVASLPVDGALVLASSMPVRDVEWFAAPKSAIRVFANRGANGIDGVTSTAVGIALTGRPTTVLLGDVAFLHDSAGLIALARRNIDLTIVVIDNGGGGIFSFLPQAELLEIERFELLFGTPHGTDLGLLAAAHGISVQEWGPEPTCAVDLTPRGVRLVIARTERRANVTYHAALNAAVADAIADL